MGARLEEGFGLVVRIRAIEKAEMKRDAGIHGERAEEFLRETDVILPAAFL